MVQPTLVHWVHFTGSKLSIKRVTQRVFIFIPNFIDDFYRGPFPVKNGDMNLPSFREMDAQRGGCAERWMRSNLADILCS